MLMSCYAKIQIVNKTLQALNPDIFMIVSNCDHLQMDNTKDTMILQMDNT